MGKKYETDGHMETIVPERLTLGNVLRMNGREGSLSAFSDSVVIGIYVQFGAERRKKERSDKEHFKTLGEALHAAGFNDFVMVKLARPYLYASNPFASIPNWLTGVEQYEVYGSRVVDSHKVVVDSTGKYSCYNSSPVLSKWEVIVGNVGTVYDDLSESGARATYKVYEDMSKRGEGRAAGESVTLLQDGRIAAEYHGTNEGE